MKYVTTIPELMMDAKKHQLRGDLYCLLGKHGYAAGSYAKMMTKLKHALEMQSMSKFWGLHR